MLSVGTFALLYGCTRQPPPPARSNLSATFFNANVGASQDLIFSAPTDDDFWFYEDPVANVRYISASDFALSKDLLNPLMDLVVNANEVRIAEVISLPGRNMTIVARTIVFEPQGQIDCSGAAGQPNFTEAETGLDGSRLGYGQDGQPGSEAGNGGHGGAVQLYADTISGNPRIRTGGGAGGRPQNGGSGAPGAPGSNGARIGDGGGNGGSGGKGGLAGQPGNGGNAGMVKIEVSTASDSGQWSIEQPLGTAGLSASHGGPGGEGPFGIGRDGRIRVCDY